MKKVMAKILAPLALVFALGFSSCDNVSGGASPVAVFLPPAQTQGGSSASPASPATPAANGQRATVNFCGTVGVGDALPQEVSANISALSASVAAQGVSKSAQPDLEIGAEREYYYYASAQPQDSVGNNPVEYGKDNQDEFTNGANGMCFVLPLKEGQWIIECGVKRISGDPAVPDKAVLRASTGLVTLNATNSVVTQIFSAAPVNDAGPGSVLLSVRKGSADVDHATARWTVGGTEQSQNLVPVMNTEVDPPVQTGAFELNLPSIARGSYEMTISFYNSSDVMVYQTVQTISVFSGMTTDKWVSNGGTDTETDLINSDGFEITDAAVNVFKSTYLYVASAKIDGGRDPNDSNEGTALAPFATLQGAIDAIEANGSATADYTIYVRVNDDKPVVKGNAVLRDLLGDPSNKKAKSITIASVDDSTPAALAGGGSGDDLTVLKVLTDVPVKIRNVKITRDSDKSLSRGIYVEKAGASVTLLGGTEISGHRSGTAYSGAGVHVAAGSLDIKGAKITDNQTQKSGGGVYVAKGASATMTSGEISANTAHFGGGVSVESADGSKGSFEITGGKISGNTATVDKQGGAVYVNGEFKVSGNAAIPYGGSVNSNDVSLKNEGQQIIVAGPIYSSGKAATITPQNKNRGTPVLKKGSGDLTADDCGHFGISSLGFNIKKSTQAGHADLGVLAAPIYVKQSGEDSGNDEGTLERPFKTLKYAVSKLSGGEPDTIFIDGNLTEGQEIPSSFNTGSCSRLTILGAGNLDANGNLISKTAPTNAIAISSGSVSALTVNSEVPITIMNLKITGGKGTSSNGGGIYLRDKASVALGDAAVIDGNRIPSNGAGGGVYLAGSDSKLFMYGTAMIGKAPANVSDLDATNASNYAKEGGGVYNRGKLYLGYSALSGSDPILEPGCDPLTGGIIGNCASSQGGGVFVASTAEVYVNSGCVSSNKASKGGGAWIYSGTVHASGGKFEENLATSSGGAIANNGTLEISGSFSVPCGTDVEKQNDVYLSDGKTITVPSAFTGSDVVITPYKWTRGAQVLDGASFASCAGKFKVSDSDWVVLADGANDGKIDTTDQKLYVSEVKYSEAAGYTVGSDETTSTGRGTKKHPYVTIQTAAKQTWKSQSYTIEVNKTLTATSEANLQSVPDDAKVKATSIYIMGSATNDAKIDAAGYGSALTIAKSGTNSDAFNVTIQNIEITGGLAASSGGGVNITASYAMVQLNSYSTVKGNKAKDGAKGAGVYVAANSTLELRSSSQISGNTADSGSIDGGGIYNDGTVVMWGGYVDGNSAANGGGIYNAGSLTLRGGTIGSSANTATVAGGAIYNKGTLNLYQTNVWCGVNPTENTDDIALEYDGSTGLYHTIDVKQLPTSTIAITPIGWHRGKQVLSSYDSAYQSRINLTDDGFSIITTAGDNQGKIDSEYIYVSEVAMGAAASGYVAGDDTTGRGTQKKPYKTIATAAAQCWNGPYDKNHMAGVVSKGRIICVNGTLTGAQTIPDTVTKAAHADKISLQGYATNNSLSGGFSDETKGTTLTVSTDIPVEITKITITGGYNENGAGINLAASGVNVTLGSNAVVSGNTATANGGGVYVDAGTSLTVSGGSIQDNHAANGGGIYNNNSLTLSSGTIGSTDKPNTATTAGGAIYNAGSTFKITGSVSIPCAATPVEKSNDVYLSYSSDAYKSITVSSSPSVTVAITPDGWHRGKQVVSQYEGSFKPTDSDFVVNATDATRRGRLDSIYIYVSESAFSGVTGSVAGDDVNGRGSRKKPYKSIATAVAQCWNGPNDTDSTNGRIIYINGTVSGAQSIPNTITTTSHASKITLYGTGTTPTLNGGGTPGNRKRTLIVSAAVPVVVKSLTITGGNMAAGGGIYVAAGSVDLASGAVVSGNTGDLGGGVYVNGGAKLTVSSGTIQSNSAAGNGGGVYINNGALDMSGGTITGNTLTGSGSGSGVYVTGDGAMSMDGASKIASAQTVHLASQKYITFKNSYTTANASYNFGYTLDSPTADAWSMFRIARPPEGTDSLPSGKVTGTFSGSTYNKNSKGYLVNLPSKPASFTATTEANSLIKYFEALESGDDVTVNVTISGRFASIPTSVKLASGAKLTLKLASNITTDNTPAFYIGSGTLGDSSSGQIILDGNSKTVPYRCVSIYGSVYNLTIQNFTSTASNENYKNAVQWAPSADATMSKCVIQNCSGYNGGGMYFCPSGAASSAITATIDNTCQIKDCAAENNGGGIYAISTAATAIHTLDVRCSITGCTAGFYGQKIFKDKNDLSMRLTVKYNGVPNEENKKAWD